jgi:hypothetical protein
VCSSDLFSVRFEQLLLSPSLGRGADAATCGADGASSKPPTTSAAVATIEILAIEFLCIVTSLSVVANTTVCTPRSAMVVLFFLCSLYVPR